MRKRIFDRVDFRIFEVRNCASARRSVRAKPSERFTEENVQAIAADVLKKVHEVKSGHEFAAIQVGPASFNILWKDYADDKRASRLPAPDNAVLAKGD